MEETKLSREELISLVQKIMNAEGPEEELHRNIELLRKNVLDPKVTDYIFWPEETLTAEQVIDKALFYRPLLL